MSGDGRNSHVVKRGGLYYAITGIQDGTERSEGLASLDEALTWCKRCEEGMNNNKVKKKNIPVYEEVPASVTYKKIQ